MPDLTRENPPYRIDLINAAMGAQRLTNPAVAKRAGVGPVTVSRIRNGYASVGYVTLKKVVEALGLTIAEVSQPKTETYRFLLDFFLGLSCLGGAGVLTAFFTASSNVTGGRMIGLPVRPVGLGRWDCWIFFMLHVLRHDGH